MNSLHSLKFCIKYATSLTKRNSLWKNSPDEFYRAVHILIRNAKIFKSFPKIINLDLWS